MPPINMNELPRLFFLYAHLMAFAITMSAVLTEDYRLLTRGLRSLREGQLRMTMKIVVPGLLALIVTGLGIAAIDTGMEWDQFLSRPKLLAKMCVVLVLVANGLLLHYFAFPRLTRPSSSPRTMAAFFCLLGAISAVSWAYASFLGIAKPLAAIMSWADFMSVYGVLVLGGFLCALILLGQSLVDLLRGPGRRSPCASRKDQEFLANSVL
jgi:hypothetical protein